MFEFHTLGMIDLRGEDGQRIDSVLLHAKRLSLLAYLCASHPPRLSRRDILTALLWPELDEAHARGSLRQELTRLRHALGDGVLLGDGMEAVGVDGQRLWSDVAAFDAALQSGDLAGALELWKGEFLPGVHVSGGEFERWLDETRAALQGRAVAAARRLVAQAEQATDLAGAVAWARRLTELAPYDETAWRQLISLLDVSGDRAGATSVYDALTARLRDELEVEPSPETHALAERIRARAIAFATGAETYAPTVTPEPAARLVLSPIEHDSTGSTAVRSPRRRLWIVTAGLVLTAAAATIVAFANRDQPPAAAVIQLLPAENRTGNPGFDPVASRLTHRLAEGLAQLPFIRLALGQDVADATAVIHTSMYRTGSTVEVRPTLSLAGRAGKVLDVPAAVLLPSDPQDASLDTLVARVLASVSAHYDPRMAVAPEEVPYPAPSLEAWVEYVTGTELFGQFRFPEAAQHMLRAYDIDHSFVIAAIFAGIALTYAEPARADSLVSALLGERDPLPPFARLWCDWLLADLHGRRAEAYQAVDAARRLVNHPVPRLVGGREALRMNRPRETTRLLENLQEGHGWWLHWTELWEVRGAAYHMLGRHRPELTAVRAGRDLFPRSFELIRAEIRARAGLGQAAMVLDLVNEALTLPPTRTTEMPPAVTTPADIAWTAAQELERHGQARAAAMARRVGLGWLRGRSDPGRAERLLEARLLLEVGDVRGAQRLFDTLAPFDDLASLNLAGLLAAARGDTAAARAVIVRLEASDDQYLSGRHLLMAAGVSAALQPVAAVETLRRAFAAGLPYSIELHALPMLKPLIGRRDFANLLRPRG